MIPANFIDRILKENRYFISRTYPNLVSSEKLVKSSKPGAGPYKPLIKGRIIRASDDDLASRRGQSFSKIMEELELARKNARELESLLHLAPIDKTVCTDR